MIRQILNCISLLFVLLLNPCERGILFASETPGKTIVFIFDASSSMGFPAGDNSTRIEVAKMAMGHIIKQLPKNADLRLIYFDGQCDQVTVFQEAENAQGKRQRELIIKKIDSLLPTGNTPLANAIVEAGNLCRKEMERGKSLIDVIVLTDGMDSCGGNPCAVVQALRRQGIAIRIHAIGFMLRNDKIALTALNCMAQATDGGSYSAGDYNQLVGALGIIRKKINKGSSKADSDDSNADGSLEEDEAGGFFLKRAK